MTRKKTSAQCTATTWGGTQCKHKATMKLAGKDVCTQHGTLDERREAAAEKARTAEPWWESAAYEKHCADLVASSPPWTTEEIDQIIAELRAG